MKTKNVRVRVKDIKHGRIIYISHPFYGIEKCIVKSKPYLNKYTNSLFFMAQHEYGESERSICDAGIQSGNGYNNRRTFFKLNQAEEWAKRMKDDPLVIAKHERHENFCKEMDYMYSDYDY